MSRARWIGLALVLLGCEPDGLLIVDLKTDMRAPDEIDTAEVWVGRQGGEPSLEATRPLSHGVSTEPVRLADLDGMPHGDLLLRVDLFSNGERVLRRNVLVPYAGGMQAVTVLAARGCISEIMCPTAADPEATECSGTECVRPECTPENPDACPPPACAADSDCPTDGCLTGRCEAGACFALPDDSLCMPPDRCGASGACVSTAVDAAAPDMDAGLSISIDAGPMRDAGAIRDAGAMMRDAGAMRDAGPACGDCDDGNPCTDDACGAGGCTHVANSAPCDDGAYCNGADTCAARTCSLHAGDPCGGGTLCDEGGDRCVGCIADSDCPPQTIGGWSPCGGFSGACDSTGTEARTITTYSCVLSACEGSDTTESRPCTRPTEGASCGSGGRCCGGTCRSISNDEMHCGGCNVLCDPPHSMGVCTGATCAIAGCDAGYGDCTAAAGCETSLTSTSSCGSCTASCDTNESCNASGACVCGATVGTVGGGPACVDAVPNARGRCQASSPRRCAVATCDAGYENCDGAHWNGCEVATQTDEAHCGACDNACNAGEVCMGSACRCNGGAACSAGQRCTSCGCVPATEMLCRPASGDEDCDGLLNCDDPDCEGMLCRFDGSSCTGGICLCECPDCPEAC